MANEFKVKNGLVVSGSADIQQDLRVRGILTVDELHTSITSASVLFESGSTIFGNDVEDIHQFTGSLNISGSILLNGTTVGTGKLDETTFNSFTSSYISDSGSFDGRLDDLESFSSSLDTSFVSEIEFGNYSSSINSFTSSIDGRVDSLETESGSIRSNFNSFTSSYNSTSSSFDTRIDTLETLSGSFTGSFTGSFVGDGTNLYNIPASGVTGLNLTQIADGSVTASVSNANGFRVNSKAEVTGSLIVTDGITGSIDYSNITNKPTLVSGSSQILITGTTGYSAFSSSVSSSIDSLSSSFNTTNNTQNGRIDSLESESGSIRTTFNSYTGSNDSTNTTQNNRLTSIENKTGSYATTGSNTFVGSQTISGSVIIRENLTVLGSSSITYTTSSQLRVDDNVIVVNTSNPAERFGGLQVYDSGSVGEATGSLFWDSQKNRWVYQQSSESTYGGGVLLSGPRSSGSLGDELTLTSGKIARSAGGDHLNDSIITEYSGTTIGINGALEITGSILSSITPLVSGSAQIDLTTTTNYISGIKTRLNTEGVISGSSQVLSGTGIWSGSAQLPSGVVSGSGQIDHNATTNYVGNQHVDHTTVSITAGNGLSGGGDISATRTLTLDTGSAHLQNGIKSYLNAQSVISSSAQVLAGTTIHSGSFFNGISVVSGSSQVSFGGISGVPSGLVSGSSQVLAGTTIHSGSFFNGITVVSGSAQVSFSGISGVPSGLVSGSSQISFGSVSGVPSGLVSGSSQITLSSTSGFSSYLNQAVLTTSSPTFDSPVISGVVSHNTSSSRNKFNVYGSGASAYAIGMQSGITYGGLNDWGMTFQFNNDGSRGFWWGDDGHSTAQGAMALTTDGALTVARKIRVGYGESDVITPTLPLQVYGSGGTIVDIQGASGQLFSVTDDLTGDIFSVSDISGMPLLNVNTTTGTGFGYTAFPLVNNLYDLGTSALRWANVYTNDLHLSNEGKVGGNDVDGTTGDWTIQEGAEKLYIINNKNGKKYKIDLTEVE